MRVHHFCFFVMLLSENDNAGLVSAGVAVWTGTEGGSITVNCSFYISGQKKLFCKESCGEGTILIQTKNNKALNGRYSLEYKRSTFGYEHFSVTIRHLEKSDSGWYMCRLERTYTPDSDEKIQIIVKEASTTAAPPPSPSPSLTAAAATTTASATSQSFTSAQFTATSSQNTSHSESETLFSGSLNKNVLKYVGLVLLFTTIVLSVAVLVFCRNRTSRLKASAEKPEGNEVSQVYEEVREEVRHGRSPPVDELTYSLVHFTKPDRDNETTDVYSLITATAQNTAESGAAERSEENTVIYSVVQANVSSVSHSDHASFPLYSTVASH